MSKEVVNVEPRDIYSNDPRFFCDYFKFNLQRGYQYSEICQSLGITTRTANNWKNIHLEFEQAVFEGRQSAVEVAENKLMQLVNGFTVVDKKKEIIKTDDGISTKITETTHFIPPNIVAIKFYLVNMRRDKWLPESRIEAQQDLLSLIQNASEKELLEVKNALIEARTKKIIDVKDKNDTK